MSELGSIVFYKTKFDISCEQESDLLWRIVLKIRTWLNQKAKRNTDFLPKENSAWSSFRNGTPELHSTKRYIWMKSFVFERKEENKVFWACRIKEEYPNGDDVAPRTWMTEIGFQQHELGKATFSLLLSYRDKPGFIGSCEVEPEPTVPSLIRLILQDKNLHCTVSGYPVKLEPTKLNVGDFEEFWQKVQDPNRDIPIIYISPYNNGRTVSYLLDPTKLAKYLGSAALVYFGGSLDFEREMNAGITDTEWGCSCGRVRVYASRPTLWDTHKHRFFTVSQLLREGADSVYQILRRALAQDIHFYETMFRIEDCRLKKLRWETEERKQAVDQWEKSRDEALSMAVASDSARQKLQEELDATEKDLKDVQKENESLKEELYKLTLQKGEGSHKESSSVVMEDLRECLENLPQSPKNIMALFLLLYKDRLDITEQGRKSLSSKYWKTHTKERCEVLWDILSAMCCVLYPLYEKKVTNVEGKFEQQTGIDMATGEGRQTRKNGELMRIYQDVYQGRWLDTQTHLKKGNGPSDPKFMRIYFAYDKETNKIIISSCGEHLDNHSTGKIK